MMETRKTWLERMAAKVPDPVVLFAGMYVVLFLVTAWAGGTTFSLPGVDSATGEKIEVVRTIRSMASAEGLWWIFDNAIVQNWLAFAHGLVGILLVAMMGIGLAEAHPEITWAPRGNHVGPTRKSRGPHGEITWVLRGNHVEIGRAHV